MYGKLWKTFRKNYWKKTHLEEKITRHFESYTFAGSVSVVIRFTIEGCNSQEISFSLVGKHLNLVLSKWYSPLHWWTYHLSNFVRMQDVFFQDIVGGKRSVRIWLRPWRIDFILFYFGLHKFLLTSSKYDISLFHFMSVTSTI